METQRINYVAPVFCVLTINPRTIVCTSVVIQKYEEEDLDLD